MYLSQSQRFVLPILNHKKNKAYLPSFFCKFLQTRSKFPSPVLQNSKRQQEKSLVSRVDMLILRDQTKKFLSQRFDLQILNDKKNVMWPVIFRLISEITVLSYRASNIKNQFFKVSQFFASYELSTIFLFCQKV